MSDHQPDQPKLSPQHAPEQGGEAGEGIPLEKNNDSTETLDEKHNKFVAALEKHGYSAQAWHAMAFELGWSVEDVKVYAYSYFKSLVRARGAKIHNRLPVGNDRSSVQSENENKKAPLSPPKASTTAMEAATITKEAIITNKTTITKMSTPTKTASTAKVSSRANAETIKADVIITSASKAATPTTEADTIISSATKAAKIKGGTNVSSVWPFDELVLLDSLMVKHCQDVSCLGLTQERGGAESSNRFVRQRTVWEKIAARIPGKTARACKEKGTSLLREQAYKYK